MAKEKKLYMIRRRSDGMFSCGKSYPWFSEAGKMWTNKSALHAHLNLVAKRFNAIEWDKKNQQTINVENYFHVHNPYIDCEVVESVINFNPVDDVFRYHASYLEGKKKKK